MTEETPKFKPSVSQGVEYNALAVGGEIMLKEESELAPEEVVELTVIAIEAITGKEPEAEITIKNFAEKIESSIILGVKNLPETLVAEFKTFDIPAHSEKVAELLFKISQENNVKQLSELQMALIGQYINIISKAQNGGDKGFIPAVASEVKGLDCSLSVWSLKEKLQSAGVSDISFEFGYPPGHAVGVVTVADGRLIYVDAQNGFIAEVELEQVIDSNNFDTAYPIYKIISSKQILSSLPAEKENAIMQHESSKYMPQYLGVREDGLLHTLGNMHMLINPSSLTFYTESARRFRAGIGMPEPKPGLHYVRGSNRFSGKKEEGVNAEYNLPWESYWEKFNRLVTKVSGGKTIYETKFGELEEIHHSDFLKANLEESPRV